MPFIIDQNLCVACGACFSNCPNRAIIKRGDHYLVTQLCSDSGPCINLCPMEAIGQGETKADFNNKKIDKALKEIFSLKKGIVAMKYVDKPPQGVTVEDGPHFWCAICGDIFDGKGEPLFFTGSAAEFDLGNIRIVPRSVDPAEDAFSCEDLAGLAVAELMEDESYIFGNETWDAGIEVFTARTGIDWSPIPELVTITTSGEGMSTEVSVEYASDLDQTDKGVVIVNSNLQNVSAYVANGTLEFELYIEDYADNVSGMVVKMESSTTGPDIFIGGPEVYPAGQWHSVSLNVADLGLTEDQLAEIIKPFVILPAWGDSQLGVKFSFRNVVLKLNN